MFVACPLLSSGGGGGDDGAVLPTFNPVNYPFHT